MAALRLPSSEAEPSRFMKPLVSSYDWGSSSWPKRIDLGIGISAISVECEGRDVYVSVDGVTYSATDRVECVASGVVFVDVAAGSGTVVVSIQSMGYV